MHVALRVRELPVSTIRGIAEEHVPSTRVRRNAHEDVMDQPVHAPCDVVRDEATASDVPATLEDVFVRA